MKKLTGFLITLFLFVIVTIGHAMEPNPIDPSNPIDPKIMLKIRARALRKELRLLQKSFKKKNIKDTKLLELVSRATSLFKELTQLNKDYPGLFALCEDKLKNIEEKLILKQENSSNIVPSINAEEFSSLLKGLEAYQPKIDDLLKDTNIPICYKKAAIVVSLVSGLLVTCTGVAYVVFYIVKNASC